MQLRMSERDKNEMLDQVNTVNEPYEAKMWGTIMASDADLIKNSCKFGLIGGALGAGLAGASGALSNQYCYLGVTATGINFVVVESFNVDEISEAFQIPFNSITKFKIKGSVIPGRKVVLFYTTNGNLKLSLMPNAITSDIQGQKEAVEYLFTVLEANKVFSN